MPTALAAVAQAICRVLVRTGAPDTNPGRHVWITDAVDHTDPTARVPGLLVEGAQRDGQWWARVAYVATLRAEREATISEWVEASKVEPA